VPYWNTLRIDCPLLLLLADWRGLESKSLSCVRGLDERADKGS